MSLQHWQETWLNLMLAPEVQNRILAAHQASLSPDEFQALQALPPERLQAIAGAVQRGRVSVLQHALPASVRRLLPEAQHFAERYAHTFPAVAVYPPALGLKPWLLWLSQQPELLNQPLLQQVLRAEIALCDCVFYAPPEHEIPEQAGPFLAPAVALVVAGPDLEALLRGRKTAQACVAEPLQGWLLARGPEPLSCLPLHWGLYELLKRLDGAHSWSAHLTALTDTYPELQSQHKTLMRWENWLRRREWLF